MPRVRPKLSLEAMQADLAIVSGAVMPPGALVGRCYENAMAFLMANLGNGWVLVHGVCRIQYGPLAGEPFGHAWLEHAVGDQWWALDPTHGVAVPRDLYYRAGEIGHAIRYGQAEAIDRSLDDEHPGPWDAIVRGARHA